MRELGLWKIFPDFGVKMGRRKESGELRRVLRAGYWVLGAGAGYWVLGLEIEYGELRLGTGTEGWGGAALELAEGGGWATAGSMDRLGCIRIMTGEN
jgi:hypothetical protein